MKVSKIVCDVDKHEDLIWVAAHDMKKKLESRDLKFVPIWYKVKYDGSSGKAREIGIQHISQQLFDYVAVNAMSDFMKRIGEFQCASMPGRGGSYGLRFVKRWLQEPDVKYYAQLDIRKCFPSIPQNKLLAFVDTYVANDDVKWLVSELVRTFKEGLAIGSYLSQYLCNLYLSQLYHEIAENMFYERRGERIRMVKHVLFYMDDILLLGSNSKKLHQAIRKIIKFAREKLGLEIKSKWFVRELGDGFIDMMGFQIYQDHVTVRKRVFFRMRRAFKKANKQKQFIRPAIARKCVSYFGYIRHTNAKKFSRKYHVYRSIKFAKEACRHES